MGELVVAGEAAGDVLVCDEGLSFWGGVDPATGEIVDAHHPQRGQVVAGRVLMMPTTRGSCTGSGVLLELAFRNVAPAMLVFRVAEDVVTLGSVVASNLFGLSIPVVRLTAGEYHRLAQASTARLSGTRLEADGVGVDLSVVSTDDIELSEADQAMLAGDRGEAVKVAMQTVCAMAASQKAARLIDITRVHIDGCIYASPSFLTFARKMADLGGRVSVPTTMNAISVDHANWRAQGVAEDFGVAAAGLADAYVEMGAKPSFTCAPYLLGDDPGLGEEIAWAESNAVVYANSVLGARTVKHPDFLDLCIAITGRAPQSGVYIDANRAPRRIVEVAQPEGADDSFWPMLGWLVGQAAPDRIPLVVGLERSAPSADDLKAMCAAFGTTSAAPMLHIAGVTPEADLEPVSDADRVVVTADDFEHLWRRFNSGSSEVDLVALGSPHMSQSECDMLAVLLNGRRVVVDTVVTLGRATLEAIAGSGTHARLTGCGVRIVSDLCWCSISEPVFPPSARVLMTNSGKYAHYAPGLSGRQVRFGSLAQCVAAAVEGRAPSTPPGWLSG